MLNPWRSIRRRGVAYGHDDPPAVGELLDPGLGHMAAAGGGENGVERRMFGTSPGAVAFDDLDIAVTELIEPLPRDLDQIMLPLDPDHLLGDAADDGGGVARAGA